MKELYKIVHIDRVDGSNNVSYTTEHAKLTRQLKRDLVEVVSVELATQKEIEELYSSVSYAPPVKYNKLVRTLGFTRGK